MANQHRYPVRGLRGIPQDTWDALERAARDAGSDRSTVVHALIQRWLDDPIAVLPDGPAIRA
ncbi:hypothetical protein IU459_32885 [Nocardia amamiensis]|uniref:Ribbon-helix-helix protein CopG domain-containing protein n=1 Tax=Nocardia amamiensis TaxID=404578 RepID=A0ABS0D0D3_9NOCA|nr:hypothetical protein [Nocardia amamiensis]MBF6302302.1 hypothetical protein [Nocardia amamiensis]